MAQILALVRSLTYVVSTPAADELEVDNLGILDLEGILLTGQIVGRQRDRATRETKYLVQGGTRDGSAGETVVKVGPAGRLVVITVYLW
jgi:hypothetical protein